LSRAIRFFTRSQYSHSAFLFDDAAFLAASRVANRRGLHNLIYTGPGSVVEMWTEGIRGEPSISTAHTPGTQVDIYALKEPLSAIMEEKLIEQLDQDLGQHIKYAYLDIVRFLTREPHPGPVKRLFCSELVYSRLANVGVELLSRTDAWKVPPDWIARSPLLKLDDKLKTT
jgi:hypothetical protein